MLETSLKSEIAIVKKSQIKNFSLKMQEEDSHFWVKPCAPPKRKKYIQFSQQKKITEIISPFFFNMYNRYRF